jgi:serine/threonine protein kinase
MKFNHRWERAAWAKCILRATLAWTALSRVKILPAHLSDSSEAKQRFEREARAISSLNHPHICTLHDVGSQDGTSYLVMEYVQGESLETRLQKGPLTLKQALE